MNELKYDPELPYVFINEGGSQVYARFKHEGDAGVFRERCNFGIVIDTTPKPKIPEDAEFICWATPSGKVVAILENYNPLKPWSVDGVYYDESRLIDIIEDAEVTVLIRKEEQ